MDLDLVGYLYNLLDPEEQARTEAALRSDPAARAALDRLRANLSPLALIRSGDAPPVGLAERTLARIAAHGGVVEPSRLSQPAGGTRRPVHSSDAEPLFAPSRWRRVDAVVAASVLILVGGLGLSGLNQVQRNHQVAACQNNLRVMSNYFDEYSRGHGGWLPPVADRPQNNFAGAFVPALQNAGIMTGDGIKPCPAVVLAGNAPGTGGYAYSIGYRGPDGRVYPQRHTGDGEDDLQPLMADQPVPASHRTGHNVLFIGGNVRFCTTPTVGVNGDHIFVNRNGLVAPGLDRLDAVLVPGHTSP